MASNRRLLLCLAILNVRFILSLFFVNLTIGCAVSMTLSQRYERHLVMIARTFLLVALPNWFRPFLATASETGPPHIPLGSPSCGEQRRKVLYSIQDLISRAVLPVSNVGLDVLHLAKRSLLDCLEIIELLWVLTVKCAHAPSITVEVYRFEDRVCATKEDLEALCVSHGCVQKFTSERSLLYAGTEHGMAERDILYIGICEMKVLQQHDTEYEPL